MTWNHINRFRKRGCAINPNFFSDYDIKVSIFLVEDIDSNHTNCEHKIISRYLFGWGIKISDNVTFRIYFLFIQNIEPLASKERYNYYDENDWKTSSGFSWHFIFGLISQENRWGESIRHHNQFINSHPNVSEALHFWDLFYSFDIFDENII